MAFRRGHYADALAQYQRVTILTGSDCEGWSNTASACHALTLVEDGLKAVRRALVIDPTFGRAQANLAALTVADGGGTEGLALRRALCLMPDHAATLNNLGNHTKARAAFAEAENWYRRCIRLQPEIGEAWMNLGTVVWHRDAYDAAEILYRLAVVLKPALPDALNSLATCVQESGQVEMAERLLQRVQRVRSRLPIAEANHCFLQLYRAGASLTMIHDRAMAWAKNNGFDRADQSRPASQGEGRRLGFLSGDLRGHAVGQLLLPAFQALARRGYELYCYSNNPFDDTITERYRRVCAGWRGISHLGDRQAAELIRADGIDILFDLGGHSGGNRLRILAGRPAPLQIAGWIGYPATTGLAAADYVLADRHQLPEGAEAYYTEQPIRLPDSYLVYDPPERAPDPGFPPCIDRGYVTFASFNVLKKITPEMAALWARILARVPPARFMVKCPAMNGESGRRRITELFQAGGIDPARLILLGASNAEQHRARMAEADIALDTTPYSGGLTTLECLWMGLPVITLPGDTFASRHSLSYLRTIGLPQLIAASGDDYVEKAVMLAQDRQALASLRGQLRDLMRRSPLLDADRFAGDLTTALAVIWQRHQKGEAPRPLNLVREREGPMTAERLFQDAVTRHQAGDCRTAAALYRRLLVGQPAAFDTTHLLGVALYQDSSPEAAARWLNRAIALAPAIAAAHVNLANCRRAQGEPAQAEFLYHRALTISPDDVDGWHNLAKILHAGQRQKPAEAAYRRALRCAPAQMDARLNLARLLHEMRRGTEALPLLRGLVADSPALAEAWALMPGAGRIAHALAVDPANGAAHANLGPAAEQALDPAASRHYRHAIILEPALDFAYGNLGYLLAVEGCREQAVEVIDRALILAPRRASHYYRRIGVRAWSADDPGLAQLRHLAAGTDETAGEDRVFAAYALGEALDRLGQRDEAFAAFLAGARRKRRLVDYDEASGLDRMERTAALFTRSFIERFALPPDGGRQRPVFIVGMPRSGTSLTEQILASHPAIAGAGELPVLPSLVDALGPFPASFASPAEPMLRSLAEAYLSSLRVAGAAHVTDKMPGNFLHLGIIAMAMPGARIIHCRRDAVDTCLSCFTTLFSEGQNFTYDLGELGRYWRAYDRLMGHWRQVLPAGRMFELDYERLVADPEHWSRALIEHCGLAWDERCLAPHRTERPVRTASAIQVQQPIHRRSVGRWRPDETILAPLLQGLRDHDSA